ncbi:TRAFs-binding domain-containing protein [Fretibacter rubidus]|uniref:TRAFs-binding domain-containing protein n=1 Tax=Fretibacter rubidus TaxID=570162 RepID=UPI00352B9C6E
MNALPKTRLQDHDYIRIYEQGIKALQSDPSNQEIQHKVVLALARAGALDLAISEYARYGLNTVTAHEDIMALNGRLSKDLYLRASGQTATKHAQDAADLYNAAFESTQGYYSAINAATMALIADMPIDVVHRRARNILSLLPNPERLTPTDHYFIEATRAECYLLLGENNNCKASLKEAVSFDPLNYAAHATTLKQFKMICEKRGETLDWLAPFAPPRAVHYAGHIRLTPEAQKGLKTTIADYLQKHDIGFGYGALAAGSDIIIAEAMLDEGVELNLIMPCGVDDFCEHSVMPFGADWLPRFQRCIERASSVRITAPKAPWPDATLNQLTAQIAMGQAVMRGRALSRDPAQLLVWDGETGASYTAVHAKDWGHHNRQTLSISVPKQNRAASPTKPAEAKPQFVLKSSSSDSIQFYSNAPSAVKAAEQLRETIPHCATALHVKLPNQDPDAICDNIIKNGAPQSLLASEAFASLLAFSNNAENNIHFAGLVDQDGSEKDGTLQDETEPMRCYALGR